MCMIKYNILLTLMWGFANVKRTKKTILFLTVF